MNKVNWMARVDHEFVPNYKVLQNAFDRIGIERVRCCSQTERFALRLATRAA
jgi:hypothetical protein